MPALNNAQLEIIKLFKYNLNEQELKQLLSQYLFKKAIAEIDKIAEEKGYTAEIIETWKDEHFRSQYNRRGCIEY